MNEAWSAVDRYFEGLLVERDDALEAALATSAAAGLPPHAVSPSQGKLLQILARTIGARRILEIGTLGGYSTIWLARALAPGGRLITLEIDPARAEIARTNLERAGLSSVVDVRVGPAIETLPLLEAPFDLVFVDADKANAAEYFAHALRLAREGSVLLFDNVVREGAVIDEASNDPSVIGVRRLHEALAREPRVQATALQTVGAKGWDGLTIALVSSRSSQ